MRISTLHVAGVRGFRGTREVDLRFAGAHSQTGSWTVLAGRNGSGKTSLLQAIALVLSGPRATSFIPSLSDWISRGAPAGRIEATLEVSHHDSYQPTLFEPRVWMEFKRPLASDTFDEAASEPEVNGEGLDPVSSKYRASFVAPPVRGWLLAGYGPYRHIGGIRSSRSHRSPGSKLSLQASSLFDPSETLADAIDWLIDQRLMQYEKRAGAPDRIRTMMRLLEDGLLPDGSRVADVTSDGLLIEQRGERYPLREMSDGYRAVTALVVDIVRQIYAAYSEVTIEYIDGTPTLPYSGVVLIDEIDAHLHVSWQKYIGHWLKEHFPLIQFIVTTHSPYVCQSADPGGLILMPGPGEPSAPHVVSDELHNRIVYGSGDDAVLTELFGIDTPYSDEAERLRRRLADLELLMIRGDISEREKEEHRSLTRLLTSSLSARADELINRLGREH